MIIDLHAKPFDEGTLAKLDIFSDYVEAWLPTFIMQDHIKEIHIFDFFSGPGYDKDGKMGSPLLILDKIKNYIGNIFQHKTKIVLHFNEFEPNKKRQRKFEFLKKNCEEYLTQHPKFQYFCEVNYYNKDSAELFFELLPSIKKFPSLLLLDQNGVKFANEKYFNELEKLDTTDFLFFISSSYLWRFGNTEEFQKAFSFDLERAKANPYKYLHVNILEQIKERLPANTSLKLYPYTIKKNTNFYGIIFGAKHPLAVDKFLNISWKKNELNGAANFDIDDDLKVGQLSLFDSPRLTKIEQFERNLEDKLLNKELKNNKDALEYTYACGHHPKHAMNLLQKLKNKKISYIAKMPCCNYDNVFKKKNIIDYNLI